MTFTLSQAAKAASKSKSIISDAIRTGRLSAERLPDGRFKIDPAELFRVFPQRSAEPSDPASRTQAGTVPEPPSRLAERPDETAVLRERLARLEETLARERGDRAQERETAQATVADLRRRLDEEQAERRSLQRQLLPAPEKPPEAPAVTSPPPRGWKARLWGR